MTRSHPYTLGSSEIAEMENAGRFSFPYVPQSPEQYRAGIVGSAIAILGMLGLVAFLGGVSCIVGTMCLLSEMVK